MEHRHANYDTLVLGAGAAGMMCAAHAGARGGRVLVIDHAKAAGEKIRISGGGRCNFTNIYAGHENFIGLNKHFHKSALSRYTQWDFLDLVQKHGIAWHEKTLGQLFCDQSAKQIVAMLCDEMARTGAHLSVDTSIIDITHTDGRFHATLEVSGKRKTVTARHMVVATGAKSIPKMGATGFAYQIAAQFGMGVTDTRAGLVPFTFPEGRFAPLAGLALPVRATAGGVSFDENMLFTHRGLSGPAMLQISSYWREGEEIEINLLPAADPFEILRAKRQEQGRKNLSTELASLLPAKLAEDLSKSWTLRGNLADQSDAALRALSERLTGLRLTPSGTEGYRTAEVTVGGVDTDGLSSTSMMSKTVEGLYFIGESVDVTGWLGGYNFQWAWSSGVAAGKDIAARSP
ncbi:hypothetical protein A9Q95_03605 [Rhodobacterales bacterium 59_46_T64]|nr:hypothetical protein A9Q95_03605 [Rhodobacterales bacterium 59_46_T64]